MVSEKTYGYDDKSGAWISYDGKDFKFEGITQTEPENVIVGREIDEIICASFLSGKLGLSLVINSNGYTEKHWNVFCFKSGGKCYRLIGEADNNGGSLPVSNISICGRVVKYPEKIAEICARYPNSTFSVCPLKFGASAIGVLVDKLKLSPRKMSIEWENTDELPNGYISFEDCLPEDGLGRMADLVANGLKPVNEMKSTIDDSPFYGKVLHKDPLDSHRVIVRASEFSIWFPQVPISAMYAASDVFVRMNTTEKFRVASGYNGETIDVFISTDNKPDIAAFMRFYKTFSNNGFVFVSETIKMKSDPVVPVFKKNRAYRVENNYEQSNNEV